MKLSPHVALALVLCLAASSYCQPPSVSHLLPGGMQPGRAVDVVIHGANLAGPTGVWSDLPLEAELTPGIEGNGTQPNSVTYRFTLPPDTPPGIAGLRVATGQGISNLKLFLVDDLPSVTDSGNNKTPESAQEVSLPMAIDGHCDGETSDYYKFSVEAGQRVAVDVFARRLGSPLDPVIRLLTLDGRELAFSDDEPSTGADSRLAYTFDTAGQYLLEIRDIRYQGGGNFRYRVRVGDFPLLTAPFPLAVQRGQSAELALTSPGEVLAERLAIALRADDTSPVMRVAHRGDGQAAAWTTVLASNVVEQIEIEPNDSPDTATRVTLPGALNGRLESRGDQDYFEFEAKASQRLVFATQARALGSPCDVYLRLYNAEGGLLAEAIGSGPAEATLNHTFAADGTYRLRVEEANRRGSPDACYRIVATQYQAGFDLAAEAEKVDAPQAGVLVVKVTAARRDYNGPITLSVVGAGEGHKLAGHVIPEGKPETTLHVTLGPSLASGHVGTLQIFGSAQIGETEFQTRASTIGALRGAFAGLPYPPAVFDGELGLGVGPVFPQFFTVASSSPAAALAKAGATAAVPVSVARSAGFEDAVSVTAAGLPAGVEAKPAKIEKGQTEGTIELTASQTLAPGQYPIKLVGSATFQNQPQQFEFDAAGIQGPPFGVAFAPAGTLAAGGQQKVALTLTGDVAPLPVPATYQGDVTRAATGPAGEAVPGFAADNRAASFSGISKATGNDRLTSSLPMARRGDYALEMWVYNSRDLNQPNAPAISGYLFSRPGTATAGNSMPGDHLGIGGVDSSPRDRLFFYDGQNLAAGRTTLAINTWHHVAIVRSGEVMTIYLNGEVAQPEIQVTAAKTYDSNQVVLGTRADGFAPFQGRLDEIAVFDAPLSPEQVQSHFAAAKGMQPAREVVLASNPLAYWTLDETEGSQAASLAPPARRHLQLAWQNLPAGVSAPDEVVLAAGQTSLEVELTAADAVAAAKLENVSVSATSEVAGAPFTAESAAVELEIVKP